MLGIADTLVASTVLAALPPLTPVYVICLIVGGGLLAVSTLFSHHGDAGADASFHADAGVDVHADAGVDIPAHAGGAHGSGGDFQGPHAHAGGLALAEWFSISFVVYFLAVFGLVGTVVSYTSALASGWVLAVSLGSGLLLGQGAHRTLRYVRRTSGDSTISARDYLDLPARVTLAIPQGQRGEVAVQVRGRERFVPAAARHADLTFATGDRVVIVAFANGTAEVVSTDEYEFVKQP